nr:probable protein phosphatase 2C 23 [Tanacetum cinerariifolium]
MGNGKSICFTGTNIIQPKITEVIISDPLDDLGHSFCYIRPEPTRISSSKVHCSEEMTTFRSISGASVSANTSTPLSTSLYDLYSYNSFDKASAFESSTSFASIPLQPLPKGMVYSGPLNSGQVPYSGPIERGFCSGPLFSGQVEKGMHDQLKRSFSHVGFPYKRKSRKGSLIRAVKRAISKSLMSRGHNSVVAPVKNMGLVKDPNWLNELTISSSVNLSSEGSYIDGDENITENECLGQGKSVEWAQGKAGEDRVHVVVVHKELKGLWDDEADSKESSSLVEKSDVNESRIDDHDQAQGIKDRRCIDEEEGYPSGVEDFELDSSKKRGKDRRSRSRGAKKWEDIHRRWKCEFNRERLELDRRLKEQLNSNGSNSIDHSDVLKALAQGLKKTEGGYFKVADQMLNENPELALMGSCVLVMLMKEEDVYIMNVGDSRAVLAQKPEPDLWRQDLERIKEETLYDLEVFDNADIVKTDPTLTSCQLTVDHSTSIEEEVQRIKSEHPDDSCAVMNDRVKGSLKVTRAFGAGFLKQPKWNDALLEMFRIDYVGNSPYINCLPSLYHHKLGPRDRFLILSSDGLYQYFTNEEAVSEVELFIQWSPEGDPAQHLIEEVLFRAAKKAGIDFHDLLEIPQGDRRRYHDDVSIIVISLEGRIWRSCV